MQFPFPPSVQLTVWPRELNLWLTLPLSMDRGCRRELREVVHPVNNRYGCPSLLGSSMLGNGVQLLHRALSHRNLPRAFASLSPQHLGYATMHMLLPSLLCPKWALTLLTVAMRGMLLLLMAVPMLYMWKVPRGVQLLWLVPLPASTLTARPVPLWAPMLAGAPSHAHPGNPMLHIPLLPRVVKQVVTPLHLFPALLHLKCMFPVVPVRIPVTSRVALVRATIPRAPVMTNFLRPLADDAECLADAGSGEWWDCPGAG